MNFDKVQKSYIKNVLEINWTVPNNLYNLSDDEVCEIVEKATIRLMVHGFDEEYEPTYDGLMCESILDILGDL